MRTSPKDTQQLAEAYDTIQKHQQLDERGGMIDKTLAQLPTLAPGVARRANTRVWQQNFINDVKKQLDEVDPDKRGAQAHPVVGWLEGKFGIPKDPRTERTQLASLAPYENNPTMLDRGQLKKIIQQAGEEAFKAKGLEGVNMHPGQQAQMVSNTGQQQTTNLGQQINPSLQQQQQQQNPNIQQQQQQNPNIQQQQQQNPSLMKKIGSGVGNLVGGIGGGIAGGAKKAFDVVNNQGKEQLAKQAEEEAARQAKIQQQKHADQYASLMGQQDNKIPASDPEAAVEEPPSMEDLAKIPGDSEQATNDIEVSDAEELQANTDTQTASDDTTLGTTVDAGGDNTASSGDNVIVPPPPATPALDNDDSEDDEEDQKQLPAPVNERHAPLGGCGFMSNRWGNFK